jgi:hypothetical protein
MAKVRVKPQDLAKAVQKEIDSQSKKLQLRAVKKFQTAGIKMLKKKIPAQIKQGKSPVERGGNQTGGRLRFAPYSDSYKETIRRGRGAFRGKRIRPVNLKLSGQMLKTLAARKTKTGFTLFYTSPIAKYHNDKGAGRSRVIRKMLPGEGQKFTKPIMTKLNDIMRRFFKK